MFVALQLIACTWIPRDLDGDGLPVMVDCDDRDDGSTAGAWWYFDEDQDGHGSNTFQGIYRCQSPGSGFVQTNSDCDDSNPAVHPEASERAGDDTDEDCDGSWLCYVDADGDGWGSQTKGIDAVPCTESAMASIPGDCDDASAATHPHAEEQCDGEDNDCDGVVPPDERDDDHDGFRVCAGDCDDASAQTHPDAADLAGNDVDEDCDGQWICFVDSDGDGWGIDATFNHGTPCSHSTLASVSGDCDDGDAGTHPGANEVCDGVDNDCDGVLPGDERDDDQDGFRVCLDCDDHDPESYPGASEVCDGVDNNCDGAAPGEQDTDGDGFLVCQGDCDDTATSVFPGAVEACDGIDNDCDGQIPLDEIDHDLDGYVRCTWDSTEPGLGDDCDDTAVFTHPGAPELCDGADNDCDLSTSDEGLVSIDTTVYPTLQLATDAIGVIDVCGGASPHPLALDRDLPLIITGHTVNGLRPQITKGSLPNRQIHLTNALTLHGIDFVGGVHTPVTGGCVYVEAGDVELVDVGFFGCESNSSGGALRVDDGHLTVDGSRFDSNVAVTQTAGALQCNDCLSVAIRTSSFTNNSALASSGGAIWIRSQNITIESSNFIGNDAQVNGGGASLVNNQIGGTMTLDGLGFQNNHAEHAGGGLHIDTETGVFAQATHSHFTENTSALGGGGFYARLGMGGLTLLNLNMVRNHADATGGALNLLGGVVTASELHCEENSSTAAGGAIFANNNVFTLDHSSLSNNHAETGGGAIRLVDSSFTCAGTSMFNNSTTGNGGAVFAFGGQTTLHGCVLDGNRSLASGGGVYSNTGNVNVGSGTIITNNVAASGGGMFLFSLEAVLTASMLINNTADGPLPRGGAIMLNDSSASATDCLFEAGEWTEHQGGIHLNTPASSLVINNSTVRDFKQGVRILAGNLESNHTTWEQNTVDVHYGTSDYQAPEATDFQCDNTVCNPLP